MKIDIGSKVRTQDGHVIGNVERVIVNPNTMEVDSLVVHKGHLLTRDVVVPLSLVQGTDKEGVWLRIGRDRLDHLPDFIEKHFVKPSDRALILPYAPGSMLVPLVPPYGVAGVPAPYESIREEREVPKEDVEFSEGTEVRTVDGPIGVIHEVLTDSQTDRVSAILVLKGHGLSRDTEIPRDFVAEVASDHVKLSLTTEQAEALPQPTADRYVTVQGRKGRHKHPHR